jgi:D-alanine-D-alanine ligase
MNICLLTDTTVEPNPADPDADWPCDPRPYLPEASWHVEILQLDTAVQQVTALVRRGFDLFFNLCDGAWDEGRPGIEVVQTLERLSVPFTGATSEFYEPSREAMKRVCRAWDIDTPAYVMAGGEADILRAAETLRFPLIAKHPSSYASNGLTRESRVEGPEALLTQARRMVERWGGTLIEEFIEGTEYTVLVAENPDDPFRPTTYTPIRYRFPEGESFKHSDMKWVNYHDLAAEPVRDSPLEARLREICARFFIGLNGAGYGRCDLRVDRNGIPFMLEINPNCGLFYPLTDSGSADLCLIHDPAGHEGFTRQVVEAALQRHRRLTGAWEVRSRPGGDYGLFATRDIQAGERIIAFEEQKHTLVSRSHVERNWREPHLSWFRRYAWPLSDEVWVIWSRDAEDWKPINHSCEPNAWLEGLDVVARRDLGPGEEITMDYATFFNENMQSFDCSCGAPDCRGTIRGSDHLKDFVARYGGHVSDHVRRRRAEQRDSGPVTRRMKKGNTRSG